MSWCGDLEHIDGTRENCVPVQRLCSYATCLSILLCYAKRPFGQMTESLNHWD